MSILYRIRQHENLNRWRRDLLLVRDGRRNSRNPIGFDRGKSRGPVSIPAEQEKGGGYEVET